jgi:hypothetical protein
VALAVIIVVEPPPEWLVDGLIYDQNCPKLVYNENDLMCKYGHTIHTRAVRKVRGRSL